MLNYTRGYFYDTLDGQDPAANWKKQSVIGTEMGTDAQGSSSAMIKNYLNANAKNPAGWPGWSRSTNESGQQM